MNGSTAQPLRGVLVSLVLLASTAAAVGCGAEADASGSGPEPSGVALEAGGETVDIGSMAVRGTTTTVPVRPVVEIPDSWDSSADELFGRYWLYWDAFAAAHAPPHADPSFEPLRSLSTETNWESLQAQLRGFAEDGLVLALPPDSVTEHLVRLPNAAVFDKVDGAEVLLQDCWIDDFIQQTLDGTVVTATTEAKLMNVVMKVVEGQWRVDGVARATPDSDGYDQCQALG
jgi:hypothetical protein